MDSKRRLAMHRHSYAIFKTLFAGAVCGLLLLPVQASAGMMALLYNANIGLWAKPGQIKPGDMTIQVGQATNVFCGGEVKIVGEVSIKFTENHIRISKVSDVEDSIPKWEIVKKFTLPLPGRHSSGSYTSHAGDMPQDFEDGIDLPWTPRKAGYYTVECSLDTGGYPNAATYISHHEVPAGKYGYQGYYDKLSYQNIEERITVTPPPPRKPPTITNVKPSHFPSGLLGRKANVYATNLDMSMNGYTQVIIDGIDMGGYIKYFGQKFINVDIPSKILKVTGVHYVQVETSVGKSKPFKITVGKMPDLKIIHKTYGFICKDTDRVIALNVTVKNVGAGSLGKHDWSLYVSEPDGLRLRRSNVWVPPLAPGAQASVMMQVGDPATRIGRLPGSRSLKIVSFNRRTGKKITTPFTIKLSEIICTPPLESPFLLDREQAAKLAREQAVARVPRADQPKHLIPLNQMGMVVSRSSHVTSLPKPKLTIRYAIASSTNKCDPNSLLKVNVEILNKGAPLFARTRFAYVHAAESGGAHLTTSHNVSLPAISSRKTWRGVLVVGTGKSFFPKLPGRHTLLVSIGPSHATPGSLAYIPPQPSRVPVIFPPGYCQLSSYRGIGALMRGATRGEIHGTTRGKPTVGLRHATQQRGVQKQKKLVPAAPVRQMRSVRKKLAPVTPVRRLNLQKKLSPSAIHLKKKLSPPTMRLMQLPAR